MYGVIVEPGTLYPDDDSDCDKIRRSSRNDHISINHEVYNDDDNDSDNYYYYQI